MLGPDKAGRYRFSSGLHRMSGLQGGPPLSTTLDVVAHEGFWHLSGTSSGRSRQPLAFVRPRPPHLPPLTAQHLCSCTASQHPRALNPSRVPARCAGLSLLRVTQPCRRPGSQTCHHFWTLGWLLRSRVLTSQPASSPTQSLLETSFLEAPGTGPHSPLTPCQAAAGPLAAAEGPGGKCHGVGALPPPLPAEDSSSPCPQAVQELRPAFLWAGSALRPRDRPPPTTRRTGPLPTSSHHPVTSELPPVHPDAWSPRKLAETEERAPSALQPAPLVGAPFLPGRVCHSDVATPDKCDHPVSVVSSALPPSLGFSLLPSQQI
ncbi:proline-rich protein 36-like [Panthera uncia]|uniref:proline-rich protein 36-like n=1 Tax=Panthera uncia TaxID=29064 RepID=UPI0020FFD902|nr:proline-rich protein 36-like [Panthera uncia]